MKSATIVWTQEHNSKKTTLRLSHLPINSSKLTNLRNKIHILTRLKNPAAYIQNIKQEQASGISGPWHSNKYLEIQNNHKYSQRQWKTAGGLKWILHKQRAEVDRTHRPAADPEWKPNVPTRSFSGGTLQFWMRVRKKKKKFSIITLKMRHLLCVDVFL